MSFPKRNEEPATTAPWQQIELVDPRGVDRAFLVLVAALAILALSSLLAGSAERAIVLAACSTIAVALFLFGRSGRRQLAVQTALTMLIGLLTYVMWGTIGLHNIVLTGYPAIVIMAGLFLTRRRFLLITALAIVSLGVITYAEVNGILATALAGDTSYVDFFEISVILVAVAAAVDALASGMRRGALAAQRGEQAIRESEERSRALLDNISEVIVLLDTDGKVLYVSPAVKETLGLDASEQLGVDAFELIHPEDLSRAKQAFAELREQPGARRTLELRMRHRNGEWRRLEVSARNLLHVPGVRGLVVNHRDITERKQMVEALEEVAKRLRLAIESAGMGFWEWDLAANQVTGEEHLLQLFGVESQQVADNPAWLLDRVHLEDRARVQRAVTRCLEDDEPFEIECRIVRPEGEVRWVLATARVERDREGRPLRMIGVAQDVTERKAAEEAQRASEEMFSKAFHANPHPMTISAIETGRIIDANPSFLRTSGYRHEEVVGRSAAELGIWTDLEDRQRLLALLEERGSVHDFESSFRMKDGQVRLFLMSAELIELFGERCVLTATADITERSRAEEALRDSERKFFNMFHANPSAMSITSLSDGRLLDVNETMVEVSGWTRDEMIGRTARDLRTWVDPEQRDRILEGLQKSGAVRAHEIEVRSKNGEVLTWVLSADIVELEGERCVLWSAIDVTENKRLGEQLLRAQRMEAMGRLAGGVAHDFNNWLTPIIGYSQLMLDRLEEEDPRRAELLEICNAGQRAADLANQLLRFSRSEIVQPKVLDLNEIVSSMERMLRRIIGEDIELATDLAPDLGHVRADRSHIEQVVMNLAVNARDAMPRGGRLTIETQNVTLDGGAHFQDVRLEPGPYVTVAVTDNGCGMDPEVQSRIFEPFFTTKEMGKGTGLGLATVYGIVQQNSGDVTVHSDIGEGTTIVVYLPRVEADHEIDTALPDESPVRGSETILLVEDQEEVRTFAASALRGYGYTVLVADGGENALSLDHEAQGGIDVLVTDVVMPRMSGPELASQLLPANPGCGLVYVSGHTGRATLGRGELEPPAPLLRKPYTAEDLARAVRRALLRS